MENYEFTEEKPKKPLTYKDESGAILKGFSQTDLDKLNKKITALIWVLGIGILLTFCYVLWLTIYVISNNVVNNIVAHL